MAPWDQEKMRKWKKKGLQGKWLKLPRNRGEESLYGNERSQESLNIKLYEDTIHVATW